MVRHRFKLAACLAAFAGLASCPAAAAPWVKGYVVGTYSYAFRYGGRDDYTRGREIQPGVDCPHGSTVAWANPDAMRHMLSLIDWRSEKEVDALVDTYKDEGQQEGDGGGIGLRRYAGSYRGYKPGIQTFINPFAANDPGEPEVQSRIGEGFNLDGKVKPTDFVSPDGEMGIDNNLYRAWGCDNPWRGNGNATLDLRANDKMQDGLFTVVIRLSGNKDPMNDDNAVLEVGFSPDHIMKDGAGKTGTDYSYRIITSAQYTKLKAKVKDGVIETDAAEIHMPQISWTPNNNRDADFQQGRIRIVTHRDGTADGLVGGYRNWRDIYAQNTFGQNGGQQTAREHEDNIGLYYALRRNADGMFNAKTGRYDGISSAYRMQLAEAYVVDPAKGTSLPPLLSARGGDKIYNANLIAFSKGADSQRPQAIPANSGEWSWTDLKEALVGNLEKGDEMVAHYRKLYLTTAKDDLVTQKNARDALKTAQASARKRGNRNQQTADAELP